MLAAPRQVLAGQPAQAGSILGSGTCTDTLVDTVLATPHLQRSVSRLSIEALEHALPTHCTGLGAGSHWRCRGLPAQLWGGQRRCSPQKRETPPRCQLQDKAPEVVPTPQLHVALAESAVGLPAPLVSILAEAAAGMAVH